MSLDELEKLAREADEGYAGAHPRDSNNWKANREFCYAVTPETVLRLVAIARAAELVTNGLPGEGWVRQVELRGERIDALRKALEAGRASIKGEGGDV